MRLSSRRPAGGHEPSRRRTSVRRSFSSGGTSRGVLYRFVRRRQRHGSGFWVFHCSHLEIEFVTRAGALITRPAPLSRAQKQPLLTNILPKNPVLLVNHLDGPDTWLRLFNSLVGVASTAHLLWIRHPGMNIPAMEGVLSCRIEQRLTRSTFVGCLGPAFRDEHRRHR